jgi:hypothetical protein
MSGPAGLHPIPHDRPVAYPADLAMTSLEFNDTWTVIKTKLRQRWDKLTDEDLQWCDDKRPELVDRIVYRTGETRVAVEQALDQAFKESGIPGGG